MYKLKSGVELPKEFKIKVNPEQSEALQKHLFSIGCIFGFSQIVDISNKYLFVEDKNISHSSDRLFFKIIKIPQIKFKDYFEKVEETSFPEKWCILVTEDNYKELDVYLHRNWKNYHDYTDKWEVENPTTHGRQYFFSSENKVRGGHSKIITPHGFQIITTDQFRKQFGKLVVHEVEFLTYKPIKTAIESLQSSNFTDVFEKAAKDFTERLINVSNILEQYRQTSDAMTNISKMPKGWGTKGPEYWANYYKEKSDRLRKEKFEMLKVNESNVDSFKTQLNSLSKDIKIINDERDQTVTNLRDEIRQLKNIIAENNVTISKQRQDIEFEEGRTKRLKQLISDYNNLKEQIKNVMGI